MPDAALPSTPLRAQDVVRRARERGLALESSTARRLAAHVGTSCGALDELLDEIAASTGPGDAALVLGAPDVELPAPASVRRDVAARVDALSTGARSLLEAVALGDDPAALSVLTRMLDLDGPLAVLDEVVGSRLVRAHRRGPDVLLTCASSLERSAVLAGVSQTRRAELHDRWAEHANDEVRAWGHRVRAMLGPDPAAAADLEGLALRAAHEGRFHDAAWAWLDAARTSSPGEGDERLLRAADAFVAAGELDHAGGVLAETSDPGPLGDAVHGYRHSLLGHRVEAEHLLGRAERLLAAAGDPRVASVHHRLALHALLDWDSAGVVEHARAAMHPAGEAADPESPAGMEARTMLGLGLAGCGEMVRARREYATLTAAAQRGPMWQRAVMGSGWLDLARGDTVSAARSLELARSGAGQLGSSRITLWSTAWLARAQVALGRLDEARESVSAGLHLAHRTGQLFVEPLLRWSGAEAAAIAGDDDAAEEHVRAAGRGRAEYLVMLVPAVMARVARAEVLGDSAEVLRAVEPLLALEPERSARLDEPGFWPWQASYAKALVATGEPDPALEVLAPHLARARERGHGSALARLLVIEARATAALGDLDAAVALHERSSELVDPSRDPLLLARLLLAHGQVLRRGGRRQDAEAVVSRARARLDAMGAVALVATCDDELRAGGRSGRTATSSGVVLTDHERRVAELVASGLSNRDVAARLFVTPKTVQYHLTRIYAQLGVRSRTELAATWPPDEV